MASNQVGSAYVDVSARLDKNADKDIKKGLEGIDVKDSGEKLGEEVGDGMGRGIDAKSVAIGNIVANVVTAAAQKAAELIGDVIGGAFENYANYQQLTGGVEKIFDEANIDGIIADASNAYRDLNMSANDYLETINQTGASFAMTMGDQKGYDVARIGMMAIADYASGTGRNLDELNEKYSMITRAASSYQSIADQFSGLLPATSADFLAQAQAAGYLSSEYTKLTEVPIAEYQEAVSLMLQKGVEDMGLAGNTAMESATTISGSIAMLSASWQNWLTAIGGGGDLSEATDALVDALGTMARNAVPELGKIIASLIAEIPHLVSAALTSLPDMAVELVTALFGESAGTALSGVFEQLSPTIEALASAFGDMAERLAPIVAQMMPALMDVGSAVGGLLLQIAQTLGGLIATALPYITSFLEWILPFVTPIVQFIASAISRITGLFGQQSGALKSLQAIVKAVGNVFKTVANTIINGWREIPGKIIGFFTGIGARIGQAFGQIHVPLPHFSISPPGWSIGDLLKGSIPSLSIQWYARGGLVDGATLIGAGEAGREAIVPLENRSAMQPFAAAVSENMGDSGTFADILAVLIQIRDRTQAVYLDGDAVGRVMAPQMNRRIGNSAVMASRGGASYAF